MPAPYSDNLYSADSDDEPDALSPTDGYFHASSESSSSRSPQVPNVFVEDPTHLSRDAKVQEAERERRLLNTGGSAGEEHGNTVSLRERQENTERFENPIATTPQPQPQSHSYSQRISTFAHSVDAPPAYSPSPISPNIVNNYQTFTSTATMGAPDETQPLIVHSHAPESMSDPTPSSAQPPSRWQRLKDFISRLNIRRKLKTFLASLLIFTVVFMIFSSFTLQSSHGPHKSPVGDNDTVAQPKKPGDFTWHPSKSCLDKPYRWAKVNKELDIQPSRNLSLVQIVNHTDSRHGWTTHISGEVVIRPVDESSPAKMSIEVISNTDGLGVRLEMNEVTQLIEFVVPEKIDWELTDKAPCIQVRITLFVPRGSVLNALTISTLQLDINIEQGVVLGVLDGVNLRSASGDINTPAIDASSTDKSVVPYTLSSREIRVHTASGEVKGWYPLYDLLDIGTVSGDITTDVSPKPVNPQDVRSAELKVRSASGTVKVDEPITSAQKAVRPDREFPPRDYKVDIITASGDITANVAASSSASFNSQSGDLKLHVWPVLDSHLLMAANTAASPHLETDTKSGDTEVNLLEPLWTSVAAIGTTIPPLEPYDPKRGRDQYLVLTEEPVAEASVISPAISVLQSKHKSISGKITLLYPKAWEGILYAQSISGSQDFQGKELDLTHEGGTSLKIIRGRKGKGYSSLEINTVSGDQVAVIGEKEH
ncbi:hypothetical protein FLONG3_5425 [Fusarium longipes]|uniref:DUF4097 domain-containing protein n=1 Tax=Fusarium longipes TaxID=694270 RepID=A0A395SU40_9HYPO|nr:hypothetical protein FLONG3_5425 [Fusarium longipes]